jgi:citrate synthase
MAEQQESEGGVAVANGSGSGSDTLTVTDNRTGKTYELPISDGTVKAMDLRQVKVNDDDFGLMSFDPAYTNTASCRSAITYIDGEAGILEYRGYPIEQLCESATYLEVAYLIVHGELPTSSQLDAWVHEITIHTYVHENVKEFLDGFRYDAHPMGMLQASVGALSTFYPGAKHIKEDDEKHMATIRMIAKVPTLAAFAYRHNLGLPYVYPDNDLSYPGNFLSMMSSTSPTLVSSARSTCSGSCTQTTSRTAPPARCATSAPQRSTPTPPARPASPRSTARCTAAPTRPCCGCSTGSAPSTTSPTSWTR